MTFQQPFDPLDASLIQQYCLHHHGLRPFDVQILSSTDSTNRYLKDYPFKQQAVLCCAETQTQVRGRLGRVWYSPPGVNIYCSIRVPSTQPPAQLTALSLVIALSIVETFQSLHIDAPIQIKWPNDVYWHDQKLGGILIETRQDHAGLSYLIIGIGLNINLEHDHVAHHALDRPWCSLLEITRRRWNRNQIISSIFHHCLLYVQQYCDKGFEPFVALWQKVDWLYKKNIDIALPSQIITGTVLGVSNLGLLKIQDSNKQVHLVTSGDIKLTR